MVEDLSPDSAGSPNWWRLTPDSTGSYVDGTWSQLASLPSHYGPGSYAADAFSSKVKEGRAPLKRSGF